MRLRHLIAALAASLAVAAPATAARPGYTIPVEQMPTDVATARAMLVQARSWAPPGTLTKRDINYILRLSSKYLQPGVPAARQATVERTLLVNAWWYTLRAGPIKRSIIRDPDGVLSTYWEGRGFAVNPVATAGRWQGLNESLAPEALAEALLPYGVERRWEGRRYLIWEYYDVPDQPGRIKPGASGMAQGRVAQLMARAYHRTGDRRFSEAAKGALQSFRVPVNRGGVVNAVHAPGYPQRPWYAERAYPGANPWRGAALNGFMVTVLNLDASAPLLMSRPNRAATGPKSQRARKRARGAVLAGRLAERPARDGEKSLQRYLPLHDTGSWSLYGLLTPGYKWRKHVADAGYHCYHVRLLRLLQDQAPGYGFGGWAAKWDGYAKARGVSCERDKAAPQPGTVTG
ncbi:MAG TPA: D-glucuronyl C5-epimerase family protein [Miltoncostaeaceae bacterium]|nr:D-glucuronyl C5-epimerase family protein [Miltoncostaeaceae bacterium]